jgi:hypothetical protein
VKYLAVFRKRPCRLETRQARNLAETLAGKKGSLQMEEIYEPPEMPPFPSDYDGVIKVLAPYYHENRPLDFFFEMYVCSVLEKLPLDTLDALSNFSAKHPTFFEKYDGNWKEYVVKECNLSSTIEIAIWDLWLQNVEISVKDGWNYHPWHYAQNFRENHFAEGSKVDVWEGNALEVAKNRIAEYRKSC